MGLMGLRCSAALAGSSSLPLSVAASPAPLQWQQCWDMQVVRLELLLCAGQGQAGTGRGGPGAALPSAHCLAQP